MRRKLYDLYVALNSPIAREGIDRIGEPYTIERDIRGLSPQVRLRERQERAAPLLEALQSWFMSTLGQLSKNPSLPKPFVTQ